MTANLFHNSDVRKMNSRVSGQCSHAIFVKRNTNRVYKDMTFYHRTVFVFSVI